MSDNPIVLENARLDGRTPQSYWDVAHSRQIEGFATDISSDAGSRIDFKVNVNGGAGGDYLVEVFRLGHYGGDGARKVAEWVNTDATVQPEATYEAARGLVDAGNWSVTDSWQSPADAVSGVYLARLQRLDASGAPIGDAVNQIPFILRDDDRPADIVLQTSDTTWHAYNGWFGNNGTIGANFYGDTSGTIDHPDIPGAGSFAQDRAYAVSYNRPFITRGIEGEQGGPAAGAQDYLFGADYAAIRWLEEQGYDVAYISGVDPDRLGVDALTKYESFISVGHDEYWSGGQREAVEAARDVGVNLHFWGGNDVYWKTRWETSVVDGVEHRTLVCYKETWAHADPAAGPADYYDLDPTDVWTGTWRDERFVGNPLAGGPDDRASLSGQPHLCNCAENSLTGQLFGPDGTGEFGGALDVPSDYAPLRVWRDTGIAQGGALDLAPGILGYEWNTSPEDERRPAGLIKLSETTIPWSSIVVDQGNTNVPGVATHNLTLYRADSGALVFGAGTVFWTWALSDVHDGEPYDAQIENADLQQFMLNVFADMGIQPGVSDAVLASQGLVRATASADATAAAAAAADLPDTVAALTPVTLSGTASDTGGRVAVVEVSIDGGATWRVASGTTDWSLSWTPQAEGTYTVLARAIDDSLNVPRDADLPAQVVEVTAPVPPESVHLFAPFEAFSGRLFEESTPLELGTRFEATTRGVVTELRYWRDAGDAGDLDVRAGHLWDAAGTLLATTEFSSAAGESGWQTAALDAPVQLSAGREYVVSYRTADNYVADQGFFASGFAEPYGILAAPGGANGVFATGAGPAFPTLSSASSNYWVDVSFAPGTTLNDPPVFTSPSAVSVAENATLATTVVAEDPDGDPLAYAVAGGADAGMFAIDPASGALRFAFRPDFEAPLDADGDNAYEVVVAASDGANPAVEQALTVRVTDEADDAVAFSTLFGPGDGPALTNTADPSDLELGARFQAARGGLVTELRYFRGAQDAGDTDTRTLNLWDGSGASLASVTVQSAPGQGGWQIGTLDTPVEIAAGATYVASYGTDGNYAYTQGFFGSGWSGADGVLSAPAGGNGVFASGGSGLFPTQSYNATNYWVDVTVESTSPGNAAPVFGGPDTLWVAENQAAVGTLAAADADGDAFTFSIAGGADAGLFAIDAATGALAFAAPPDFEAPADADGDNRHDLVVAVSDGIAPPVERAITVVVTDDPVEPGSGATALLAGLAPQRTVTDDPADYELGLRFQADRDGDIVALRYFRGAEDAGDTDIRTLTLWTAAGQALGSATLESAPGRSGWQTASLDAPVAIEAGAGYVASYGTERNYAFTRDFFPDPWTGPDGVLVAPSGGNGVLSGTPGAFPTASYADSNYWVDVVFQPDDLVLG